MNYRGTEYTAPKIAGRETPRYMDTDQALELIRPTLKRIGVTRISDFTNMDRTGIPVAIAVRPTGNFVSAVTFGKGLHKAQAMVSAGMEMIERYAGSETDLTWFYGTYRDVAEKHAVIAKERLLLSRESFFHEDLPVRWTLGWDIVADEEVAVPLTSVRLFAGRQPLEDLSMRVFQTSSNGLAAGVHFAEAVAQGLTEVIERDGLACHGLISMQNNSPVPLGRIDPDSIPYTLVQDVLARFKAADVEPMLFDCTTDLEVPTYTCTLVDKKFTHFGTAAGYGANLNPETAMLRAMTEAMLGRAEAIQGIRESNTPCAYHAIRLSDNAGRKERLLSTPHTVDGAARANQAESSFHADIERMTGALSANGYDQVIVLDITPPESDVPVVRVIVPGLEGVHEFSYSRFGERAHRYAGERA